MPIIINNAPGGSEQLPTQVNSFQYQTVTPVPFATGFPSASVINNGNTLTLIFCDNYYLYNPLSLASISIDRIDKAPLIQGSTASVFSDGVVYNNESGVIVNNIIYVLAYDLYGLNIISSDGTTATNILTNLQLNNQPVQVFSNTDNSDYLYITNYGGGSGSGLLSTISRYQISTSTYEPTWISGLTSGIAGGCYFNNNIYYVNYNYNSLGRILNIDSATPTVEDSWVDLTSSATILVSIVTDGVYLYISYHGDQIIILDLSTGNVLTNNWLGTFAFDNSAEIISLVINPNTNQLLFQSPVNGTVYTVPLYTPPDPEPTICFLEDSKILTDKGYVCIQDLKKGDLIKTLVNEYLPIYKIGKKDFLQTSTKERKPDKLYKCCKEKYPELIEDLIITGCHCILVDDFLNETERNKTKEVNGDIYITDNKYRLPACVDERTSIYEKQGKTIVYHIALENADDYMNYGIYANGLLVESCSKWSLENNSNMKLLTLT